jgi:hypothetical protein
MVQILQWRNTSPTVPRGIGVDGVGLDHDPRRWIFLLGPSETKKCTLYDIFKHDDSRRCLISGALHFPSCGAILKHLSLVVFLGIFLSIQ